MHDIQAMEWIIHFLRSQARMRGEGNDERGILDKAAALIEFDLKGLYGEFITHGKI